jgi:hypothetical protein
MLGVWNTGRRHGSGNGPQIEALKSQIAAIDERLNRIAKALTD